MIRYYGASYANLPRLVTWAKQRHQPYLCGHKIRTPNARKNDEGGQLCLYLWCLVVNQPIHVHFVDVYM